MEPRRWSLIRFGRPANPPDSIPTSMLLALFVSLFALQIIENSDQAKVAKASSDVVRVVRVDVPKIFPVYDPHKNQPVLLLGCAYRLRGGEYDDENGGRRPPKKAPTGTTTPAPELAVDQAIDQEQRDRGLVVKWYFRRNPVLYNPDPMSKINDNEQVYQWMPGEPGGALGALIGHAVDITDETPRMDKTTLHRIIRVDRPSYDLTGEYRCQVEDWTDERRSAWQPMVVYLPERVFKVLINDIIDDDNDDNDKDNNKDEGGNDSGNVNSSTTTTSPPPPVPTTTSRTSSSSSSSASSTKDFPTKINVTCYAAGMHPEPSMSIWVNGVMQDSVTTIVLEDDGDDEEANDFDVRNVTNQAITTTGRPRVHHFNRYTSYREGEVFTNYSIRANKVVSIKDVEQYELDGNNRTTQRPTGEYRPYTVVVECRLKMPGDGTADGYWKQERPSDLYYSVRKSVAYKYRADPPPPPPPDAFTSVSSASSVEDAKDAAVSEGGNNAGSGPQPAGIHFIQSMIVAGVAAAARQ